jgi:hypothetical protein
MAEGYGPEDASIPAWEAPPGAASTPPPPRATAASAKAAPPPTGVPTFRSWQPGFMPLRPLTLGDFVSLPVKAISANRAVIVGGPLLCIVVSLLFTIPATWLGVRDAQDTILYGWAFEGFEVGTIIAIAVAAIAYFVIDSIARCLVVPGVSRAILGQRITLSQAWTLGRSRIPHLLLLYLYLILVVAGVGAVFVGLVAAAATVGGAGTGAIGLVIFLLAVAAIPGFLFLVVIANVAPIAVILEGEGAAAAIRRTVRLLKGSMWRYTGISLVLAIILSVISNAFSGVAELPLVAVASTVQTVGPVVILGIILIVLAAVAQAMITYSYMGTASTLMYVDARIRNEGFDIDLARAAEAASAR